MFTVQQFQTVVPVIANFPELLSGFVNAFSRKIKKHLKIYSSTAADFYNTLWHLRQRE